MINPSDITTYLAIDLETTGLDAVGGAILEVAAKVLDAELRTITQYHSTIECSRSMLLAMDPFVIDMHKATGLLQYKTEGRPFITDGRPLPDVYRELLSIVQDAHEARRVQLVETATDPGKRIDARLIPLGASLHGVDRPFLRQHMPLVDLLLSHRHCDSSAMKAAVPGAPWPKEDEASKHTAGADIDHAIACVRFARQVFGEWMMVTSEHRPMLSHQSFGYAVGHQDGTLVIGTDDITDAGEFLIEACLGRRLQYNNGAESGRVTSSMPNPSNLPRESVHEMSVTEVDVNPVEVTVTYSMDGGPEQSITFDADSLDLDVPSSDLEAEYVAAIESGADATPVALADAVDSDIEDRSRGVLNSMAQNLRPKPAKKK